MLCDAGDELLEVVPGEGPVEGGGDLVVVVLERVEAVDDRLEAREVIWSQDFALHDGEHDLDLVQPGGVEGEVHEHEVGPLGLETVNRSLPAVGGAVVDDPEHTLGVPVGIAGHDLLDQPPERRDPGLLLTASGQVAAVHVPGGEVAQRAATVIVMLDTLGTAWSGSGGLVGALPGLDLCLLVRADHVLAGVQQPALPAPLIQIENRAGTLQEPRVAREHPGAVLPRFQGVLSQPARDR